MIIYSIVLLCAVLALLLCFAAFHDIATRTVPNWVSVAILACGVLLQAIWGHLVGGLLVGGAVLIGTFFLWRRGCLGGADVKLLTTSSASLPLAACGTFLLATAIAGGVVALIYLGLGRLVKRPAPGPRGTFMRRLLKAEAWRIHRGAPIPYATAIASGALFTLISG